MTDAPPGLIQRFADLHVLVVGEAILDSYLEGSSGRLCREAPVPIVSVARRRDAPGGAANTAANVRSLGARVTFLSAGGDDPEAALLRAALAARGLDAADLLTQPGRRTLAKHRVSAAGHLLVRFDQGDTDPLAAETEARLIARLEELYPRVDAVIVSDYGYGVLTERVRATLAALQARAPCVLVADAKDLGLYRAAGLTAAKPNYADAVRLLGVHALEGGLDRADGILAHGQRVLDRSGAQIAAVTLDVDGALILERGRPSYRTYTTPAPHSRAAGAGDTYTAALTLALAAGAHTPAAAEIAAAAAEQVIAHDGTLCCSAEELRARLAGTTKQAADLPSLVARLEQYRRRGRRIVFTNGCFDILHRGHITYLSRAKALGDVLVVGVNSDAGVQRLKGPDRPINALEDRVGVLAALSCVDELIAFDEPTPEPVIEAIRPDVFVKGGDYTRETLPEAALVERLGGVVRILPYLQDRSTSSIIERIRDIYGPPHSQPEPAVSYAQPETAEHVAE